MAFQEPWDSGYESRPTPQNTLRDTLQPTLVGLKVNVRERAAIEHYWGDGGGDGAHKIPTGATSGRPFGLAGRMYGNGDRWALEFYGAQWEIFLLQPGSRIPCFKAGVPAGWFLVTGFADRVLRITDTAGIASGGSWTITGFADAGAVNLSGNFVSGVNSANVALQAGAGNSAADTGHTHTTTVSFNIGNHNHAFTPGWRPAYVDGYIMEKN